MGNLATLYPVLSPMLWTSIATGKRAHKHGIYGFAEADAHLGVVRPITNLSRKTKAVWNILSQEEKKCIVVGWWPSHPAEPLPGGVMVSNQYHQALSADPAAPWPVMQGAVHPERLAAQLGELRVHPADLSGEHILPFVPKAASIDQTKDHRLSSLAKVVADAASVHAAATELMQNEPWDFMAVYFDAIDHFGHGFMSYHPPRQQSVSEEDFELYSGVVEAAYRYHDMMLGVLMATAGPETTVMLISDHGFHPDHLRPKGIPAEPAGPAIEHRQYGIFALAGPGIKRDERVYGATLLDICPTLLTLFGLPVGSDMDGKPLVTAWETAPDIDRVPSWDAIAGEDGCHPPDRRISSEDSREAIRQLEELGYIQPLPGDAAEAIAETERELQYNLACSYTDSQMSNAAAAIFEALWERWPREHRFGTKLLSCHITMGRIAKAREVLIVLLERQQHHAKEAAVELKYKLEGVWKDKAPKDFAPREVAEYRKLVQLANVTGQHARQFESLILLSEGKAKESLEILETMGEEARENPEFYLRLGQAHLALKDWAAAEENFRGALKLDPDNAPAHTGLAQAYLARRRDFDAAGMALKSTGLIYHFPQAHFVLGIALHRLGYTERAVDAFRVAVAQNPNLVRAHRRLALIYERQLNDPERAAHYRDSAAKALIRIQNFRREAAVQGRSERIKLGREVPDSPESREFSIDSLPAARSDTPFITIVTGLPRSGTSMMMQLLAAGGLPALHDDHRPADEDNPRGYLEFAPAKNLRADSSWLSLARGRAVKLVAQLLPYLQPQYEYRIIFMERSFEEVLASQQVMLDRHKRTGAALSAEKLEAVYKQQLQVVERFLGMSKIPVLRVPHRRAVESPETTCREVAEFLSLPLDAAAMTASIDPSLHRRRRS